jgi:hypothetical protein
MVNPHDALRFAGEDRDTGGPRRRLKGSRDVRQKLAIYAVLLAASFAGSAPAFAQAYPPTGTLRRFEVVALVRSTGLEPLSRPVRQGPTYVLHAVNPAGREVRVVVDARQGHIVRVIPLAPARNVAALEAPPLPPPYARPPAGIAAVPDGYGPNSRTTGLATDVDGPSPYGTGAEDDVLPAAPGRPASASPSTPKRVGPPPLPRPRPKLAAAEPIAPPPVTPASPHVTPPAAATGTNNTAAPATPPAAAAVPAPVYEQYE